MFIQCPEPPCLATEKTEYVIANHNHRHYEEYPLPDQIKRDDIVYNIVLPDTFVNQEPYSSIVLLFTNP